MRKYIYILVAILVATFVFWYLAFHKQADSVKDVNMTDTPKLLNSVTYSCDGGRSIKAAFYEGQPTPAPSNGLPPTPNGSITIALSDGTVMTLKQTISADGARYANSDESFVFWSKGNGAMVLENGKEKDYTGCVIS